MTTLIKYSALRMRPVIENGFLNIGVVLSESSYGYFKFFPNAFTNFPVVAACT